MDSAELFALVIMCHAFSFAFHFSLLLFRDKTHIILFKNHVPFHLFFVKLRFALLLFHQMLGIIIGGCMKSAPFFAETIFRGGIFACDKILIERNLEQ